MSETTLDQIRHWRDRAVQGVATPLTTVQIIRLCDAAERAETLEADCEVERMRLAACMTAALGNTRDAVEHRIPRENPYWSAAYGDVCRAVHAEIVLRGERDALSAQLTEVTRQFSAAQAHIAELSLEERDLRASLAPLRAVVEAAKAFSAAWLRWSRSNAIGVNVVTIDAAHTLCEALDAIHADPSAPTQKG